MVFASLTLDIPERTWIGAVSRTYPDARFQVRSARSSDGVGIGLVQLLASDPDAVCTAMIQYDAVHAVEVFSKEDDRALVQIEAAQPILLRLLDRTGVPVQTPFEIRDGTVDWDLTTTRDRLSSLASTLDRSELEYMIECVSERTQFEPLLTDRQQEVLETALESGYYDSPRECTQEELADELDLAKSTCSEILHRAEERVIKRHEDASVDAASPMRSA